MRQAQQILKEPPAKRGHEQGRSGAGRQRRSLWGIRSSVASGLCAIESRTRGGARGESRRCAWMSKRATAGLSDRATWRSEMALNIEIRVLRERTTACNSASASRREGKPIQIGFHAAPCGGARAVAAVTAIDRMGAAQRGQTLASRPVSSTSRSRQPEGGGPAGVPGWVPNPRDFHSRFRRAGLGRRR